MKLVCISDTHLNQDDVELPDGDILIHAGDLASLGNFHEFRAVGQWFKEIKYKFKHIIIIGGNHDFSLMINSRLTLQEHFDPEIIYLEDKSIVIDGVKFYGSPWSPQFYDWAFMKDDDSLAPHWAAIDEDTDVLITHTPPHGILDKNSTGFNCGSRTLYQRVKQLKNLKHHIFGHIHHSYGKETIDDVCFHNVCSLNDQYVYQNPPQVIQL